MATVRTFDPTPNNLLELQRALRDLKIQVPPSTYDHTTAPGAADDITQGWRIGSKWFDINADEIYECADNAQGAAVWRKLVAVDPASPNPLTAQFVRSEE